MAQPATDYNTLLAEYKKLAKKADQRLVRIEKNTDPKYANMKQYAYAKATKAAVAWGSNETKPRFNVQTPNNIVDIKRKIKDIKSFLNAPTSTKQGIKRTSEKMAKTINDKYGTDFTWEELASFYERGLGDKYDNTYGSDTILRVAYVIKRNEITSANVKRKLGTDKRLSEQTKTRKIDELVTPISKSTDEISVGSIDEIQKQIIEKLAKQGLNYKNIF